MKQGGIFTKTRREAPKDEVSRSAQLLIRAGFIHKEMAGVYTFLPLGLRVLKKIENVIRDEMNALGATELNMTALQDAEIWKKTDRWDDTKVDNWFKTKLKNDSELGLATTHEEPITKIMCEHINSYKDLPVYTYQFQTKFRNELRAKSGIMRGREFLMKDLYSFSADEDSHNQFYEKSIEAYFKIFKRLGLGDITYLTVADGGNFGPKYSHEFQTLCEIGEDLIYIDEKKRLALNKEVLRDDVIAEFKMDKNNLLEKKAIEVGNIYSLGTRYTEPLELVIDNPNGERTPVVMGSYGIGVSRLMGTIAEIFCDENGLNWPISVSPFDVHILNLNVNDDNCNQKANEIYKLFKNAGLEVLLDDRDVSGGVKFTDSDLIGIPYKIIIGKNSLALNNDSVFYRKKGEANDDTEITINDLIRKIQDEKK
jgi:prolyl-tRNA synthetase